MDHEDVLEQLELAAVEPGGLERLAAGDTLEAAAVAGHLAGCSSCADELRRLTRAAPLLRDVVRTTPAVDLRDRTLAFVRERGRERGPAAAAIEPRRPAALAVAGARRTRALPWVAAIAAAVVLSIGVGGFVARQADERAGDQAQVIAALERVTAATLELTARPDVRRVALASTASGGSTTGSLLFSPSTTRLVVVAEGLPPPPAGREYRCWIARDGGRANVGRMFFAGDLAFWIGDTPEVGDAADGTTFGVSLTEVGGTSLDADPVILGKL